MSHSHRAARCGKRIVYRHQRRRRKGLLGLLGLFSEIRADKPTVVYTLGDPPGSTSAAEGLRGPTLAVLRTLIEEEMIADEPLVWPCGWLIDARPTDTPDSPDACS